MDWNPRQAPLFKMKFSRQDEVVLVSLLYSFLLHCCSFCEGKTQVVPDTQDPWALTVVQRYGNHGNHAGRLSDLRLH